MTQRYFYMFDPPGFAIEEIPKWRDYIASLERLVTVEDPESEDAKAELKCARRRFANLEAWRDEEAAEVAKTPAA